MSFVSLASLPTPTPLCLITCLPTVTPPLMIPRNGRNGVNLSMIDFTSLLKSLSLLSSLSNSSLLSIASSPPKRSENLLINTSVRKEFAFSEAFLIAFTDCSISPSSDSLISSALFFSSAALSLSWCSLHFLSSFGVLVEGI